MMNATLTPGPVGRGVPEPEASGTGGSWESGCLPLFQFMVPPSTITPPMVAVTADLLVADSTTMSAPCLRLAHCSRLRVLCRMADTVLGLDGLERVGTGLRLPMVST